LERKLREKWGFEGTPIDVSVKVRESKARDARKG
ncbi:MAG: GTPase Der, partial [Klenkia sp.]|nr:GTPase Der [Klenkia sp.]